MFFYSYVYTLGAILCFSIGFKLILERNSEVLTYLVVPASLEDLSLPYLLLVPSDSCLADQKTY